MELLTNIQLTIIILLASVGFLAWVNKGVNFISDGGEIVVLVSLAALLLSLIATTIIKIWI